MGAAAYRVISRPERGADEVVPPPRSRSASRLRSAAHRSWRFIETLAMVAGLGWVGAEIHRAYDDARARDSILPGVRVAGADMGGLDRAAAEAVVTAVAWASVERPLTLVAGGAEVQSTPAALGAAPVLEGVVDQAMAWGRSGDPRRDVAARLEALRGEADLRVGAVFESSRALAQLQALGPRVERPSLPTRLDFDARRVLEAEPGAALLAYDSLSAVALGLAAGESRIELSLQPKPKVEDPLGDIADSLKIDVVVGTFETPYQAGPDHADRNHNLKVGAAAIDGFVLGPGETFSFNAVVGDRSAEEGYRYATGIAAGELIDVVGGGICQVSSTLFGAAFFAGLEVVSARPHSRPSSYVDMGLDSTVVWPDIDLKLRNPFAFPVVFHMTVSRGKVVAQVLGPARPYQVVFRRTLQEVLPYRTVWRDDETLRAGTEVVAQQGRRGFVLERVRELRREGDVVQTDTWTLRYPPTTEILRRGTNPEGEVPAPASLPPLREPAPTLQIEQ